MKSTLRNIWEKLFSSQWNERPMELLPKELRQVLPPIGTLAKTNNPIFYIRFFIPANNWSWFIAEGEPYGDNDFRFYGFVMDGSSHWDTVTLSELEALRGPNGCPVWRNEYFDQSNWEECLFVCGMDGWCTTHGYTELEEAVNSIKQKSSAFTH